MNNAADDRRSIGLQIPVFGEWENANEMPITRYFDCARQAGLLRCTCSGQCAASFPFFDNNASAYPYLQAREVNKLGGFSRSKGAPIDQPINRGPKHKKKGRKSGNLAAPHKSPVAVKPVDEDLYKISPELVKNSKRGGRKMLRFFSRCMASPCAA